MTKQRNWSLLNQEASERGFTLIEMLIVIALIGLLTTFVGSNIIGKFTRAKVDATKIQMRQIGVVLDDFKKDCNFYPTTDQGLGALIKPPAGRECKNYDPNGYLKDKKIPVDSWSQEFLYESDGSKYKLTSLGSDGKAGGEGVDKDLVSDDL